MAASTGSIDIPILARVNGKDVELGVLSLPVKVVNGRIKLPAERDIKTALRKGLR